MTAIQTSPITDSLPQAIRALESAELGDVAVLEGHAGASAIRMGDSGTPWLLDPYGHNDGPAHVTTAYLATQGYRLWGRAPRPAAPAPRMDWDQHIEALRADGWTPAALARAAGLDPSVTRRAFRGGAVREAGREAIYGITPGEAHPMLESTTAERIEDVEFLLNASVKPEEASARAGFPTLAAARKAVTRAGRDDLAARLPYPSSADQAPSLDDYDPYDDPTFKEADQ